jgi:hypothetical protein
MSLLFVVADEGSTRARLTARLASLLIVLATPANFATSINVGGILPGRTIFTLERAGGGLALRARSAEQLAGPGYLHVLSSKDDVLVRVSDPPRNLVGVTAATDHN